MAGCTTVAIFPTESAETVRFVLEHSEAFISEYVRQVTEAGAFPVRKMPVRVSLMEKKSDEVKQAGGECLVAADALVLSK